MVSSLAGLLTLTSAADVMLLSLVAGFVAGCVSLACAWVAVSRNEEWGQTSAAGPSAARVWAALAVSLLLVVAQGYAVWYVWSHSYYLGYSAGVAPANLRGIGESVRRYYDEYDTSPATFDELIAGECITRRSLVWVFDDRRMLTNIDGAPLDSSYAYHPGLWPEKQDAEVVVAFEKSPWTIKELRLFYEFGHSVLFADGQVRFVAPEELASVLERDQRRREELGWPVCEWGGMYP